MVKRLINLFEREITGLHEAAYLLAIFALFSHVLAVVRDRLLASTFGASEIVDVYYASFRIPDLLFVMMTFFVSSSILVPILSNYIQNKTDVKKLIDSLFTVFLGFIIILSLLIFIFARKLLSLTAPGILSGVYGNELVLFTRVLLLSPILLGISQLFGSVVQAYRKFFVYAISPILYNLGIIVGILYLYPTFGLVGLVMGVVLGSILHVLIQLPTVSKHKLLPKLTLKIDWKGIRDVASLSLPRTIALASSQIVLLVFIAVASGLVAGSIAIFNFAYNLQSVPLSIIGVSYSLAAFPTLSRLFASGDKKTFLSHLISSARHIIFWSFPVIVMFIVLRAQIIRTILGAGEFGWNDTRLTAAALALFAISVLAQSLILLFVRGYYSAGQTRKPVFLNTLSAAISIGLLSLFISIFQKKAVFAAFFEELLRVNNLSGTVVLMLPLAFSLGVIINATLLWISFEKDFKGFSKTLWRTLAQSFASAVVGGYVAYIFLSIFAEVFNLDTFLGIFLQGFLSGIIGLVFWIIILILFKNAELKEVWTVMHHKFWRIRPPVADLGEL